MQKSNYIFLLSIILFVWAQLAIPAAAPEWNGIWIPYTEKTTRTIGSTTLDFADAQSIVESTDSLETVWVEPGVHLLHQVVCPPAAWITLEANAKGVELTGDDSLFVIPNGSKLTLKGMRIVQTATTRAKLFHCIGNAQLELVDCDVYFYYINTDSSFSATGTKFTRLSSNAGDSLVVSELAVFTGCEFYDTPITWGNSSDDTVSVTILDCYGYNTVNQCLHMPNAQGKGTARIENSNFIRDPSTSGYCIGISGYATLELYNSSFRNYGASAGGATLYAHNVDTENHTYTPKIFMSGCDFYNHNPEGHAVNIATGDTVQIANSGGYGACVIDSTEVQTWRLTNDAAMIADNVYECDIDGGAISGAGLTFATDNNTTMAAIAAIFQADAQIEFARAVDVGDSGYVNTILIKEASGEDITLTSYQITGGVGQAGVTLSGKSFSDIVVMWDGTNSFSSENFAFGSAWIDSKVRAYSAYAKSIRTQGEIVYTNLDQIGLLQQPYFVVEGTGSGLANRWRVEYDGTMIGNTIQIDTVETGLVLSMVALDPENLPNDSIPSWTNITGRALQITAIGGSSNSDDYVFRIMETDNDGDNFTQVVEATISDDGVNIYYIATEITSFDHDVIENGHKIWLEPGVVAANFVESYIRLETYTP